MNSNQFTDELKFKLREGTSKFNRLTKSKKVIFTEIETGINLEFNSWREASINLKISRNTIKKYINTSNLYKGNYKISTNARHINKK